MTGILQAENAECGLACLAIAATRLGSRTDLAALRRKNPTSVRGLTVAEMSDIAQSMQLATRAVRCDLEDLRKLALPAILHWDLCHFVVLIKASASTIEIEDPAVGRRKVAIKDVSRHFTGIALEVSTTPAFVRQKQRAPLKLTSLFRFTPSLVGALLQTLVLSLLLQAYVLVSPFYLQVAIDEAALKGDRQLLTVLAIAFGAFAFFNLTAEALRGIAVQRASSLLAWDMTIRLYKHLVRLPLPWFQRRRLADTLTRFDSLDPIRNLISTGLITSVLDGLLAISTLVMMTIFAWKLAAVAGIALAIHIVIRALTIRYSIRLASDALVAHVAEQGKLIETIRAIQTIKALAAENSREMDWANRYADVVRTRQKSANTNTVVRAILNACEGCGAILIIFLGASAIIDGQMTVGVLFAFIAYRQQFHQRSTAIFETFVNWKMLDMHSDRLADIALTPVEEGIYRPGDQAEMQGAVVAENLSFRYAPHEPFVFQNLSFSIAEGEFVAFVGPSGAGKTTLLKVLCGLYPASAGEVRIDGRSLAAWGPKAVRSSIGFVLQDDELLSGSISENVTFFGELVDVEHVWKCLRLASFAEDVLLMPMGLETLVGDAGVGLSGGQKQRLLLARALYRHPRILVLDEATSHLDSLKERNVNESLRQLGVTRVIVAHRPETIAAADRVLLLKDGRIVSSSRENRLMVIDKVEK